MAVPARKTSKTRKRLRRTHYKLSVPGMSACPNCGAAQKVTSRMLSLRLLR